MPRTSLGFVIVLLVASCTTGVAPKDAPAAVAHVELLSLSPPQGSEVTSETELVADIKYRIDGFKSGVDYYVAPVFASRKGAGVTFSMVDLIDDTAKIHAPEGRITIRHPVARELASPNLARPMTVWFYLMERIGTGKTRVVGKTGPLEFRTAAG